VVANVVITRSSVTLAAALLTAVAVTLSGCETSEPDKGDPPLPVVTVSRPVVSEVTDYFEFPGQTEAVGEVEIRARVAGYLVKINFEDGQEVHKGDILFEIDPRPYQLALERANGDLERLKALLAKAQSDVRRADSLRPSGAISDTEYEQSVAQLKTYQASIDSAEAAVREAELNLEFTHVESPIDGRIGRRLITEGNLIQSGSNDATLLTTVVTTKPIYVYFNIEEPALLKFQNLDWRLTDDGQSNQIKELQVPVEIGLQNEDGFPHRGMLDFLDNKVDRATGTIRARGVFDNREGYLTPGLFVRARVPFGKAHSATLVPERAILADQRQKYLLTVDAAHVVQRRDVKLGTLHDGLRVIESGIGPDDVVIVKGLQRARPGAKVNEHFPDAAPAHSASDTAGASDAKTASSSN
jgi:RND family efflux transporter MFP subunit